MNNSVFLKTIKNMKKKHRNIKLKVTTKMRRNY